MAQYAVVNDPVQVRGDDGYDRFRALADTLQQLVLYVDDREICRAHNVAVENILGLTAEQIDLRSLREVAGAASYECIHTWVARALAGEQVYLRQVHRTAGGRVLAFEARYAPHFAADGRVLGFCAILAPAGVNAEARPEGGSATPSIDTQHDELGDNDDVVLAPDTVKRSQTQLRVTSALQGNRFCLFQQPIVSLLPAPAAPRTLEVLLRLRDEDNRLIHPGAFLREAEETGCSVELDRWVVDRLVSWYVNERSPGSEGQTRFHINLSMSSIVEGNFPADLRRVIEYHRFPADMLCFELNESDLARHRLEVVACLQALRILGCRVGLDRFTGESGAFSGLLDLPIDFVKIDGSIVAGMHTDPRSRAKMRIISRIAATAKIATIAERVEDEGTIELVRALGIDYVQGYGVSMPEPLVG